MFGVAKNKPFFCCDIEKTVFFQSNYHFFFPLVLESENESEVAQLGPTLYDPMDCSVPCSSVHRSFQARSRTRLSDFTFSFMHWRRKWQPTPVFLPGFSSSSSSRQEYWSGLPFPSPEDLPDPVIEPASPALVSRFFTAE